jgi:hypothetical protein
VKIQYVLIDKGLGIAIEEIHPDLTSTTRDEIYLDKKALAVLCLTSFGQVTLKSFLPHDALV